MDNPVGTCKYSLMLNEAGGIEADVTVTRIASQAFYIVSGAAYTQYVMAYMQRKMADKFSKVQVDDVTHDFAILSLQGPQSQKALTQFCASQTDKDKLQQLLYGQSHNLQFLTLEGQLCKARYCSF